MATGFNTARGGRLALAGAGAAALVGGGYWLLHGSGPTIPGVTGDTPSATSAPAPPPPPPPWTREQLGDLLSVVRRTGAEGLTPADYKADELKAALDAGRTGPEVDALASGAALTLAHDFAAGHVRRRHRYNWYIDYAGPDDAALAASILSERQDGHLSAWLDGLLPTDTQYRALRTALADTSDDEWERRDRIKANMERWRWLPRDFGKGDQLYVNLPTYHLEVIRGGETVARYKAVIGATDMPTPVLSASVRQIIVNPDWIVPQSIVRKSHLRPGASSKYIFTTRPDGTLRVRQKPGAGNALGKVKIEFPNKLAIYFHDTPSRSLFGASVRTFSHGCVRVQNIDQLAASIVPNQERFATAMAGATTRSFPIPQPWHANIVYLTLVRGDDGGLQDVGDPYKMDEALAAAIENRKPRTPAPPPLLPKPDVQTNPGAIPVPTLPLLPPVPAPKPVAAPAENAAEPTNQF